MASGMSLICGQSWLYALVRYGFGADRTVWYSPADSVCVLPSMSTYETEVTDCTGENGK